MKALSIQQPWAHAILTWGKLVENRNWSTKFRGRFLIHAGKGFDELGWNWIKMNIELSAGDYALQAKDFLRGGIVGMADLIDVVSIEEKPFIVAVKDDPWFCGPYGFILSDALRLPFTQLKGSLGFFETGLRGSVQISNLDTAEFE